MKGAKMPPNAGTQMKSMGLDQMVADRAAGQKDRLPHLSRPAELRDQDHLSEAESAPATNDFKMEITELGKDTVDGHPCVKNKSSSLTRRNQTRVHRLERNGSEKIPGQNSNRRAGPRTSTMLFKNVSLAKPAATLFDPPAGFNKYDNVQQLMQQEMMKRMGGGTGMPPTGH